MGKARDQRAGGRGGASGPPAVQVLTLRAELHYDWKLGQLAAGAFTRTLEVRSDQSWEDLQRTLAEACGWSGDVAYELACPSRGLGASSSAPASVLAAIGDAQLRQGDVIWHTHGAENEDPDGEEASASLRVEGLAVPQAGVAYPRVIARVGERPWEADPDAARGMEQEEEEA